MGTTRALTPWITALTTQRREGEETSQSQSSQSNSHDHNDISRDLSKYYGQSVNQINQSHHISPNHIETLIDELEVKCCKAGEVLAHSDANPDGEFVGIVMSGCVAVVEWCTG